MDTVIYIIVGCCNKDCSVLSIGSKFDVSAGWFSSKKKRKKRSETNQHTIWWIKQIKHEDSAQLMSHLFVLFIGALPWRSGWAVLPLFSRGGAVTVGSSCSLLGLPLLQHLVQVEPPPVVHKEVLHLAHRLITDDVSDGLEVFSVFPDTWRTSQTGYGYEIDP